jgi:hypothetical protein
LKERGLGFQKWLRFGAFTLSKGVKAAESSFVILLMKHLCKIEGLSGATNSTLFESISSQTAVTESFQLALREPSGPGLSEDDPIVLVVQTEDAEKRSASTA